MQGRRDDIEEVRNIFVVNAKTKTLFRYRWLFYFSLFLLPSLIFALILPIAFGFTKINLLAWGFRFDVICSTIAFLYPHKIGLSVLNFANGIVNPFKEHSITQGEVNQSDRVNEKALAMIGESSIEVQESGAFLYYSNLVIEFLVGFILRTPIWGVIFFFPVVIIMLLFSLVLSISGGISFDSSNDLRSLAFGFGLLFWLGLILNTIAALVMGLGTCVKSWLAMTGVTSESANFHFRLGARIPSSREREKVIDVLQQIVNIKKNVIWHDEFLVIDAPLANAFTSGRTLYLTSEAINSTWLNALIAHECGHLANGDGRLLKALRDFVYGMAQAPMISQRSLSRGTFEKKVEGVQEAADLPNLVISRIQLWFWALLLGGVAPILFARRWTVYFRQRDYLADDFAYQLGFGQDLLDYLQSGSAGIAAIAPGAQTWTQFTELRIDRLLLHFQKEHFVEAEEPLIEFEENIQEE